MDSTSSKVVRSDFIFVQFRSWSLCFETIGPRRLMSWCQFWPVTNIFSPQFEQASRNGYVGGKERWAYSFGKFLIAYRSYHYAIHHPSSRLEWYFRRCSLYIKRVLFASGTFNVGTRYYAMVQTKGLHCSLMAICIYAIIILVYPILL